MINLLRKTGSNLAIQMGKLVKLQSVGKIPNLSPLLIPKASLSFTANQHNSARTDLDLHQFLVKEIRAEKEVTQVPKNGQQIPGFDLKTNGADVTLTRKFQNEQITIKFNVNSSVDGPQEFSENVQERPEDIAAALKSRPDFVVEVRKSDNLALVFNCGFLDDETEEADQVEKNDLFEIQNFYLLENGLNLNSQITDSVYLADGTLIDGQFYDLLMDYLDERGIGSEFAENLTNYATFYEHEQYINLLDKIKGFITNN